MALGAFLYLCITVFLLVNESQSEVAGVEHNSFLSRNIQDTNIPSARFSSSIHRSKRHYGYGRWGMPYGGYGMGMPFGGFGMPFDGFGMPFGGFGMPFMGFG
ncbi:hypothetical protein DdX_16989 [Ditylenchus destructor]|uniref:Uncharacterized protein n=1 Tax=Ditylenchus destructor TaxID=166010 RepID=A0AAD4MPR9_9BILA|nr:hypothetical protein DdX_16989 [Ditylenchus destructor]